MFPSIFVARGQRSKPLGPDINGVFYLTWKLECCAGNDVTVELTRRCFLLLVAGKQGLKAEITKYFYLSIISNERT